jgi:hypothetical protein
MQKCVVPLVQNKSALDLKTVELTTLNYLDDSVATFQGLQEGDFFQKFFFHLRLRLMTIFEKLFFPGQ